MRSFIAGIILYYPPKFNRESEKSQESPVGYTMMCYRAPDDERQQAAIHHPARKKDSE